MGKIPEPRPIDLPRRLRMARDELPGVTAARMAELLMDAGGPRVSGSTITGWERGVSRPSLEVIELWADLTGVDLLWLTYGRDDVVVLLRERSGYLPTCREDGLPLPRVAA